MTTEHVFLHVTLLLRIQGGGLNEDQLAPMLRNNFKS